MDEKLEFKVIEFSKATKRIILSHSKVYEGEMKGEAAAKKKGKPGTRKKAPRKIKSNLEKTTLGDISDLAAIKTEIEEKEKKD